MAEIYADLLLIITNIARRNTVLFLPALKIIKGFQ
jgi:hypothetical protein